MASDKPQKISKQELRRQPHAHRGRVAVAGRRRRLRAVQHEPHGRAGRHHPDAGEGQHLRAGAPVPRRHADRPREHRPQHQSQREGAAVQRLHLPFDLTIEVAAAL